MKAVKVKLLEEGAGHELATWADFPWAPMQLFFFDTLTPFLSTFRSKVSRSIALNVRNREVNHWTDGKHGFRLRRFVPGARNG